MMIQTVSQVFLAALWPPDFRAVFYFLTGTVFGFTLCSLSIAAIFLGREKKRDKARVAAGAVLTDAEVKALIRKKQDLLPELAGAAGNSWFRAAFESSVELMYEIAAHYYPDKRYPIYELTPQELIDLDRYVVSEIEKILNGKIVRRFKRYRISTIVEIVNRKKQLDDLKFMKMNKQYQISKILGTVSTIMHAANPVTWIKKAAIKPLTEYVTREAAKQVVAIVGKEVDKLYSRKMFAPADDAAKVEAAIEEAAADAEGELPAEPDSPAQKEG